MKNIKLTGAKHEGPCEEVKWGSDDRFTVCKLCGMGRFYKDGYIGSVSERPKPVSKKPDRPA